MKKSDKIFLVLFIGIVTFSLLYLFQASYAKYRKQIKGEFNTTIASWNIKVNNETINNKTDLTNTITPVIVNNSYVKANVVAPGTTGYFDITLDASDVDVDFIYEITSVVDEDNPLYDLRFYKYVIGGVEHTFTQAGVLTGDMVKNSSPISFRIYFEWYDGSDNTMNNADDTAYATNEDNVNTNIKVSIHFTQNNGNNGNNG